MSTHPFAGRSTRILGMREVAELIDVGEAIESQRAAFRSLAAGTVTSTPNLWLRLPDQERRRGWLKILAGHDSVTEALGVKVLARFADNPPGANLGGLILLFDEENGFPQAIVDAVLITGMRTGAGAGLATAALAAPDARQLGVVGTGVVAWHSIQATLLARPSIEFVTVYSRSAERREATAARIASELGVAARAVDTVERAVDGAEVLITATNSPEPILGLEHVSPGVHINAMGIRTELAPAVVAASWVVPDGVEEALADGKFSIALEAGAVSRESLGPQLGELLDGSLHHRPGRTTLFDSSGVVVQDLALARRVLERAEAAGTGVLVDLGLAEELVR